MGISNYIANKNKRIYHYKPNYKIRRENHWNLIKLKALHIYLGVFLASVFLSLTLGLLAAMTCKTHYCHIKIK